MKRNFIKRISLFLLVAVSVGYVPNMKTAYAINNEKEIKEYEIYPIPQSIEYEKESITIPKEINVVYKGEVDEATKNHLQETLNLLETEVTISEEIKDGEFNILVALSSEETGYTAKNPTLFEKFDANVLEIKNESIKIIGNDTDAIYCAVTTLESIIKQSENNEVLATVIEDYADIEYRGYIEGYYGIPWSNEEMISLMEFGSDTKLNTFIFAPKDDPYHNSRWREPYPQDKLDEMQEVIEAGVRTKNRFVYAIHPFMSNGINKENYESELQYIIDKFETLYDLGVRQFSLLADDAVSETALQVKVINTLTDWLDSKEGTYPLIFCPQAYSGTPSASYYNQFRDGTTITIGGEVEEVPAVKEDVEIMHTGPAIIGNVDDNINNTFNEVSGRYPYMWLNWPVNDYTDSTLFIGKAEMLRKTDKLNGLVSNPMCEAELSKIGLFQIADFAWNTDDFDVDESWDASFKSVDPYVENELRILARHMSYPRDGVYHQTGLAWEESEDLKEPIDALKNKLEANENASEEANTLKIKLEEIINAANSLMENSKNEGLVNEFDPYAESLIATLEASIAGLNSIIAIDNENYDTAWNEYSKIANKIKASDTVTKPGFKPGGYTDLEVKPGTKRLRPLAKYLNSTVGKELNKILGLDESLVATPYYNFKDWSSVDASQFDKYIDGDLSTYASLESGGTQQVGDYFGLDLGKVKEIKNISINQGSSDTDHDIFHYAVLEVSNDGEEWTTVKDYSENAAPNNINIDTNVSGRYVRLRLTERGYNNKLDYWLHVREMSVVVNEGAKITSNLKDLEGATLVEKNDGIELSLNNINLASGEYIGIELPKLESITIEDIELPEGVVIEHSENYKFWDELNANTAIARYIVIRNKSNSNKTITSKFNINIDAIEEPSVKVTENYGVADANGTRNDNPSQKIFAIEGLEAGKHKLTIVTEPSGTSNDQYKASVDKLVIQHGDKTSEVNITTSTEGLTLKSNDSSKPWNMYPSKEGWLNNDEAYLVDTTGVIEYEFEGVGIELFGAFGPDMCKYNYYIDGVAYNNSLNNVFDGQDSTKGHYKTDNLTIDLGQKININKVQVKVAEDVATETPEAVLGEGKIEVSADGENWSEIKSFNIQGNELSENGFNGREVPYFWMDIELEDSKEYRYIRIAYEEEKEFIINEISINDGQALLGARLYELSTTEPITNSNLIENLVDKQLETQFTISKTDNKGYLDYKLTDKDQVSSITIVQNAETISNAKVEVLSNNVWKSIGTLEKSINIFDVSSLSNVTKVKVSFDSLESDTQLMEISYKTDSTIIPPTNEVNKDNLIALVEKSDSLIKENYIENTLKDLEVSLVKAKEVLENNDATIEEVNQSYKDLCRALLKLRLKPSKDNLDKLTR